MATSTTKKDSQPAAPSKSTVAALNKIRSQYHIVSTDYSNIFSVQANTKDSYGNYETLGQSALGLLGDSYASNNKVS